MIAGEIAHKMKHKFRTPELLQTQLLGLQRPCATPWTPWSCREVLPWLDTEKRGTAGG